MIRQCDNFAKDAHEIRAQVVAGEFSAETGPDGAIYTGISKLQVPQWFDLISKFLGAEIVPRISCFRLNLAGELPHSWVHSDDICARYASVLYLNLPTQCQGGTAFWRHKTLGVDHLLATKELGPRAAAYYQMMTAEWKKQEAWEQVAFIGMQFNRFITYPTNLFHSRYPFEAFGKGPQDGRLIWICFYDIKGEAA